ncbi:MAG: flagellar motor switch phosphatase FliY [Defluviitaleaceae bacterium]|nr:flagellar motor switch phosphatase FliY [Defluviitaleaceae bacterium]
MSEMLSQDEMDALLSPSEVVLSDTQKDILGEVGNISMGTSATTLSTLLNQKVEITTPKVEVVGWAAISAKYDRPCVGVKIDYTFGIKGSNVLILKNTDVKIIADLMMGGSGQISDESELTEIDLSAIGEAMNQMIGSSSTSLSSFIGGKIDIATPKAFQIDFSDEDFAVNLGFVEEPIVAITFSLEIGTLLRSEIIQIYPVDFALDVTDRLQDSFTNLPGDASQQQQQQAPQQQAPPQQPPPQQQQQYMPPPQQQQQYMPPPQQQQQYMPPPQYYNPQQQMEGQPHMGYVHDPYQQQMQGQFNPQANVNAKPAQFQAFDMSAVAQQKENIDILMDVPLEVTVELGKTSKRIKEILEFSPGTIIELDKLAGEPIDILVNGKYVAKGEVVVIDENFGIRVTSIINPEFRI